MNVICDKRKPPLGGLIAAEHLKLFHKIEISWGDITVVENGQTSTLCASSNDLCRVLARLLADKQLYGETALEKTEVDHWLSYSIGPLTNKHEFTKSLNYLNRVLGPVTYLVGKRLTIADFAIFAALYANKEWQAIQAKHEVPIHVQRWYNLIASRRAVSNVLSNLTEEIKTAITSAPSSRQSLDRASAKLVNLDKSVTGQRNQEGKFVELPGAEMGKVVVRFPPEASGYLHIGHAKAALLNQYYQQAFDGKLIMRFDDTNPAKENVHFEQVILEDLEMLEIKPDLFTHTSNYFDLMIDYCVRLLKDGKAYVDDTEPELMKQQREQKIECANRSNSVEKNLEMWQEMVNGTEAGQKCCVRAKIDMKSPNGCMRDPTIYRCKNEIHPRTGTKYKVYPTYDFACPIVDAIEGVTHTLRTMEYHDRDAQFYWFIEALDLRKPNIWEYSRLSMTNTVLSKRKLTWFVQQGLVDGWDDPRFPTVRGVLRRGMTVEGLKQFIIAQGSSRSVVFMEWDKIWAFNKKVIDPIAPRYTALESDNPVPVLVHDAKLKALEVPTHPKNLEIGNKKTWIGPKVLIDYADAEQLKQGENTTFINWGNLLIKKINRDNGKIVSVEAQTNLDNKEYKKTLKLTWLCETEKAPFTPCYCVYFDHIISKPVLGKDDDFKKYIGHETRVELEMLGDPELRKLKKGDIIQLQRRGFFKVDVAYASPNEISLKTCPIILFHIPDGHKESPLATITKNKKGPQKRTASELVSEILKQEEIISKSVAQAKESAQKHLNNLKNEFSNITKLDWNDKRIQCKIGDLSSNTVSTNTEPTIICSITEEQVNAEKDPQLKELLSELLQIRNSCGLTPSLNATNISQLISNKAPVQSANNSSNTNENSILEKIQLQGEKVRDLKTKNADKATIDTEVKTLLAFKADYKNVTGKEWKPETTPIKTKSIPILAFQPSPGEEEEILNKIVAQGEKVHDIKAKKADQAAVDAEVKILLALLADYKSLTGKDWKPTTAASKPAEVSPVSQSNNEEDILNKIATQGEKVRDLKTKKADKAAVDAEVKILLALKADYKTLTGTDWKPGTVAAKSAEVTPIPQNNNEEDILNKIAAQGEKVRDLKSKKADKAAVDAEVKILLALKADYKTLTGTDWKPGTVAAKSAEVIPIPQNNNEEDILNKIAAQGEKVRDLKSKKADKAAVDAEVKILLALKADYKTLTGKDWKPGTTAAKPAEVTLIPQNENEEDILNKIAAQGEKVRDLKSKKADKAAVDAEVKILLALKADYKTLTGKDWKPGTVASTPTLAASSPASASFSPVPIPSPASASLSSVPVPSPACASLSSVPVPSPACASLSSVPASSPASASFSSVPVPSPDSVSFSSIPTSSAPALSSPTPAPPTQQNNNEEEILHKIAAQGEKVRDLKSKKADKATIDSEVKVLLTLKADYKTLTGKDWKPGTAIPQSSHIPVRQTPQNSEADIQNKITEQGDKIRKLKAEKADKSIIDAEVKSLLVLKEDYKTRTGKDWKPETAPQSSTVSMPAPNINNSIDISVKDDLTVKINDQGNVVRNLKSLGGSKENIDVAVKVLLDLKAEYKKVTGTDFPVAGRGPSKPKEPKPKEAKPAAIKKVPSKEKKPVDATEGDGLKKQTRLGLEAKKEENLPDWYSQVITKGEMIEYYDVSGCYIYRPWSYAIWELIKNWFDEEIKKLGVQNCYFPIFVSKSVLEKEKTHIADFAPEVAWVTKSGDSDMAEPIAVRPTSETVMYPAYAKWIQSYRDLPIKLNQWNNVVRWEFKHPQPFLRTREFLWQEGHTAYATVEEAQQEVSTILDLYARIYTDLLAIPVIKGRKTEKEKFAGGDYTLTVEAYVSASGRAIQGATSHHLGQNFSKMFDITFEDPETQDKKFVYQNSWGVTTRTIGVMIMIHADNQGLVLPPQVASVQIVIVPCGITVSLSDDEKAALQNSCDALESDLSKAGVRIKGDYRNNYSPGWKFNHWELKGVPIRVELGPKDMKNNQLVAVRRDTGEKITIQRDNAVQELSDLLKNIQQNLYNRALDDLNTHKVQLNDWSKFTENLDNKNIILAPFCGETECEDKIKADSARDDAEAEPGAPAMGAKTLCIPLEQPAEITPTDKCIHPSCNRKPKFYTLFGRSY